MVLIFYQFIGDSVRVYYLPYEDEDYPMLLRCHNNYLGLESEDEEAHKWLDKWLADKTPDFDDQRQDLSEHLHLDGPPTIVIITGVYV